MKTVCLNRLKPTSFLRFRSPEVLDLDLDRCLGDLDPSSELLITVLRRSLIAKMAKTNASYRVLFVEM